MRSEIDISLIRAASDEKSHLRERGKGTIIAFIDSGIDVLHETFKNKQGKTRIIRLWDQTDNTGPSPNIPDIDNPFGTEHTSMQINTYINNGEVPTSLGRDSIGHGTLVASIAAGKAVGSFQGGIASEAEIIFIKVDTKSPDGLETRHAQALSYIEEVIKIEKKPVVVNVSQGTNFGPHDGMSNHEKIFEKFLYNGHRNNFALVKSAGNQREARQHAQLQGPKEKLVEKLIFRCGRSYRAEESFELWFDYNNKFEFRLINPSGERSNWIREGGNTIGTFKNSQNLYYLRYRKHYASSPQNSLLSVIIEPQSENPIETGHWILEIKGIKLNINRKTIDAWAKKASQIDGTSNIRFSNHIEEKITLTNPGTAENIIVVGSHKYNSSSQYSTVIDNKSSIGPTRKNGVEQPTLVTPGIKIYGAKSGTFNKTTNSSGTSLAAPQISGIIALILAEENSSAIKQSINQRNLINKLKTKCIPKQAWNYKTGWGSLIDEDFIKGQTYLNSKILSQ